jgi:hypothetical protein
LKNGSVTADDACGGPGLMMDHAWDYFVPRTAQARASN